MSDEVPARDIWAEATPWGEYVKPIVAKKIPRAVVYGRDHSLPAPYNKRGETREADVLKACRQVLRSMGVWHRRIDGVGKIISSAAGKVMTQGDLAGMPDILACVKGKRIAIEVKCAGGKVSSTQYATLREMHEAGAEVLIVCNAFSLLSYLRGGVYHDLKIDGWLRVL
jgi:hypothetical protein